MMWPFGTKTLDDKFSEEDLTRAGFKDIRIGFGSYNIWAKNNHRILYDPIHDRVHSAYDVHQPSKKMSIEQINEILQAVEHLRHGQNNQGSE